ncbi:MAG: tetratricopeptide repeat protein, partial [Gammaproteobacteria bacterium]
KVLDNYPSSNKVPDAMLKLGYTFYELKQFPQAKSVLTDLRTKFPNETAARLAAKRLDRIRKEGY